jgi:hypothetical protein
MLKTGIFLFFFHNFAGDLKKQIPLCPNNHLTQKSFVSDGPQVVQKDRQLPGLGGVCRGSHHIHDDR